MKEITKRLDAVGATRLPGWGLRDPHCACLKTLQSMLLKIFRQPTNGLALLLRAHQ
ncbi:hypothetical protein CSKR_111627, partial [Clonorchis sinensis]